jgi:AcrR family transcriptional regulator
VRMKTSAVREEVQELKRRRILEAARDLFYELGYETTTLDAIAEGLQVTKPFIYSYYRGKSEILRAICEIGISSSLRALDEVLASKLTSRVKLRRIVENVTAIIIQNQKYIVVYNREEKNLDAKDAKQLMSLRREFGIRLAKLLDAGTKGGDFDVKDSLLTAVVIGGLLTWVASWYRESSRWSQIEVINQMVENVEHMVCLTKSR